MFKHKRVFNLCVLGGRIVIGFILPLLLPTPSIWVSLDRKRRSSKRSRNKRSDYSDSDSVALMTPLTIPIFEIFTDS